MSRKNKLLYEATWVDVVWNDFSSVDETVDSNVKEKLPYEVLCDVEKCYEAVSTDYWRDVQYLCEAICVGEVWNYFLSV